ncbi:hypothetical protein HDU91_001339, partial [Kappamyces sp. JEL0680]
PSVIFIDEIDSLLTSRTEGEQEATRRMKTEFLVQFDGCGTDASGKRVGAQPDRILMIGATNRPGEIDEAARRRFRKKLYIPLPEFEARMSLLQTTLMSQNYSISESEMKEIVEQTNGYSGSDMDNLIREAALGPMRDVTDMLNANLEDVRPITHSDFQLALKQVWLRADKRSKHLSPSRILRVTSSLTKSLVRAVYSPSARSAHGRRRV